MWERSGLATAWHRQPFTHPPLLSPQFLRDFIASSWKDAPLNEMKIDLSRLPGQARYWALHCGINALPSFIVAVAYLQMVKHPSAVAAMILGILTFIVGYTILTSIDGSFSDSSSLLSRALKVGVKIRFVISLISLPLLAPTPAALFVPDVWAGMLAVGAVNWLGGVIGAGSGLIGGSSGLIDLDGGETPFFAVYATTVLEGMIISFMLMMLSFFSLLVLQAKQRNRRAMEIVMPPDAS